MAAAGAVGVGIVAAYYTYYKWATPTPAKKHPTVEGAQAREITTCHADGPGSLIEDVVQASQSFRIAHVGQGACSVCGNITDLYVYAKTGTEECWLCHVVTLQQRREAATKRARIFSDEYEMLRNSL